MLWLSALAFRHKWSGLNVIKILKKADIIFLENFTSPIGKHELSKIKKFTKKKLKVAPRWMV